jgi:RimJ/RimL family protein N-acetyltransferase
VCVLPGMDISHRTSDVDIKIGPERRAIGRGTPHDGPGIAIRPVEPFDRIRVAALFDRLSPESRHRRFFSPKPALSQRELTYLTVVDHRWREAVAAVAHDGAIVGIGHYGGESGRLGVADVAVVVADEWQHQGIGTALGRALIARARLSGFRRLTASTMWENRPARALLRRLGFYARASQGHLIDLELDL